MQELVYIFSICAACLKRLLLLLLLLQLQLLPPLLPGCIWLSSGAVEASSSFWALWASTPAGKLIKFTTPASQKILP